MKWLILLTVCVVGCAPADPPVAPVNPGTGGGLGTRPDGGTGGIGGGGGEGGTAGGGGAMGACDNATDLDAIQNANDTLRSIARDCRLLGIPSCIEGRVPGLSTQCASCYRQAELCSNVSNCTLACQLDTCAANCLTCATDCITDLQACTGLPGDGCPG